MHTRIVSGGRLIGLLLFAALPLLAACSRQMAPQKTDAGSLQELSQLYMTATQKLNRPPKDAEELKPYLAPGKDINTLLTSGNDGQPFVVVWGADPRTGMDLKPLVIAYEKQGKGGARFVYTAMGVFLMGDEDFKQANFPPGHTPQ